MLGQHIVDVNIRGNRIVLLQMANIEDGRASDIENEPQLARRDFRSRIVNGWILSNPAMKVGGFRRMLLNLAYEINVRRRVVFLRACCAFADTSVMTPASSEVPARIPMKLPTVGRATEVWRRRPIVTCDPRTEITRPSDGVEGRSGISFNESRCNISLPGEMTSKTSWSAERAISPRPHTGATAKNP